MNKNEHKPEEEEKSVLSIIQDIKNNLLDPKTLFPEERQRCVDFLLREGYTREQVAQIFVTTDRTIRRDLVEIRKKNALTADINLVKETIGDMFQKAMMHHAYLVRLARSSEASVAIKGQLEFQAWTVLKEMVVLMQNLGFLPSKPQAIVGEIFHHVDGKISDLDELTKEIIDIENMADGDGKIEKDIKEDLTKIKTVLDKMRSSEKTTTQEDSNEDTGK
jgi:hypothetical protein